MFSEKKIDAPLTSVMHSQQRCEERTMQPRNNLPNPARLQDCKVATLMVCGAATRFFMNVKVGHSGHSEHFYLKEQELFQTFRFIYAFKSIFVQS